MGFVSVDVAASVSFGVGAGVAASVILVQEMLYQTAALKIYIHTAHQNSMICYILLL